MTSEEYRNSVLRSESPDYHGVNDRILHAVLGIVTEAGELADVIKKEAFYGRKPDKWKLLEELGDCRWYEELLCDELDVTMEEVKEMNIKKLKERYPDQFDDVEVRDYEAEQRAAEVGAIGVVSPGVKDLPECAGQLNQVPGCSKCNYKQQCFERWNAQFEDRDAIPIDQGNTDAPDCFGKARLGYDEQTQEGADHNSEKCMECLSRGPCVRAIEKVTNKPKEEERPVPECFGGYQTCSIYCTTVCDARTLCKAETPE